MDRKFKAENKNIIGENIAEFICDLEVRKIFVTMLWSRSRKGKIDKLIRPYTKETERFFHIQKKQKEKTIYKRNRKVSKQLLKQN